MKTRFFRFHEHGMPSDVFELAVQELPDPGPGQALVRIRAIGLNRSEMRYTQGRHWPVREFPSCVGQEAVGEIVALGPPAASGPPANAATPLEVGARVALLPGRVDLCGMGAYREFGLYDRAMLAPVPDAFSDDEGAAYWMGILTMGGCLEQAGLNPVNAAGKRVLITAATSSMGVVALKLAKAWGAETLATTRSAAKGKLLEDLADHVIVCSDSEALGAGIAAATRGAGIDVALDPVGPAFYPGIVAGMAEGGCVVSYELMTGPEAALPLVPLLMKDLTLRGFAIPFVYRHDGLLDTLIEQGMRYADAVRPIIAKTFPWEQAAAALAELAEARHVGKLVLRV